jgi:putative flippase GtrA
VVGAYNTAVGYAVFATLVLLFEEVVHYTVLLVVASVIGTLNAFVSYRVVVFGVRGRFFPDLLRFSSVYLAALGVNVVALPVVVSLTGMPVLVAQVIIVAFTTVGTYAGHKWFSFRRPASG